MRAGWWRGLRELVPAVSVAAVKIKMVVGEIAELERIVESRSKNGFQTFMYQTWARLNHETGEVELDDEHLRALSRYMRSGYKKKLLKLFGRTLGPELAGLGR